MTSDQRKKLSEIKQFKQLIAYLRDEMGWPINSESEFDELTYEYTTTELGIDDKSAAQIQEIKRLRPLSAKQPWGVFFVKFEPKKLPVVALRRILGQVALKKRASANPADRTMWAQEDLLFISNYGEGDDRQITLAHFSVPTGGHTLPSLKVLGWDSKDTVLHLEAVARELTEQLSWPDNENDVDAWRTKWRTAFTVGHQEVITTSKALSIRLAQLARDIRDRTSTALKIETENGPLTKLMKAFRESLVSDLTPDDFSDMYAQTIAYGLLSSRIADPKKKSVDDLAAHMRLSPFLRELMETFLRVGGRQTESGLDFDELGVGEVVDLLDQANMEAVVLDFGDKNPQEDPVIHFYERFLHEYDPDKRMSRGVFYTPRPVVSFIVRSVDKQLREQFGLADGLADTSSWREMANSNKDISIPIGVSPDEDFVQILDPATGTGTFLVEVISEIYRILVEKWKKQAKTTEQRVALWNQYVQAHLLTRLHGFELMMAPYSIAHLKIALKLQETGYTFSGNERAQIYLTNSLEPGMELNDGFGFAIPAIAHESAAVNKVKLQKRFTVVIGNPPYSNFGKLNKNQHITDMLRTYKSELNEQKINLDDDYIKFIRLSQLIIETTNIGVVGLVTNNSFFDGVTHRRMREALCEAFQVISLVNLHGNSIKGEIGQNVFDIRVGVGISIAVRSISLQPRCVVQYMSAIDAGANTREEKYQLLESALSQTTHWVDLEPESPYFWFTATVEVDEVYNQWISLSQIFDTYSTGIKTKIDAIAVDFNHKVLSQRIKELLSKQYSLDVVITKWGISEKTTWEYDRAMQTTFTPDKLQEYEYRPFDVRFVFYDHKFLSRSHRKIMDQFYQRDNIGLSSGRFGFRAFITRKISDEHFTGGESYVFPLWRDDQQTESVWGGSAPRRDNLTTEFKELIYGLYGVRIPPEQLFGYVYGLMHSLSYRSTYATQFSVGFPRIPLARSVELFSAIASIGMDLVDIHSLQAKRLKDSGVAFFGGHLIKPEKVVWEDDVVWLDKARTSGFSGVKKPVWDFRVGDYQVCAKWLKDRRARGLTAEDIEHYVNITAALSETIRQMELIDEAISIHGGWPLAFGNVSVA